MVTLINNSPLVHSAVRHSGVFPVLCGLTLYFMDLWRFELMSLSTFPAAEFAAGIQERCLIIFCGVNISRFVMCNWPTVLEGRTEALLYGLGSSPSLSCLLLSTQSLHLLLPSAPPLIFHSFSLLPLPSPLHSDTLNWSATTTRRCDRLPARRWLSQAAQRHGSWSCRPMMHHSALLMLLLLLLQQPQPSSLCSCLSAISVKLISDQPDRGQEAQILTGLVWPC